MNRITFQGSTQEDFTDLQRAVLSVQLTAVILKSRGTPDGVLRISKKNNSVLIEADEGCRLEEVSVKAGVDYVRKKNISGSLVATFHYEGITYVIRFGESRFNVPHLAYEPNEDRVPF